MVPHIFAPIISLFFFLGGYQMNGLLNYFDLLGYRMLKTEDDMYHKALIITDRVYKSKDEYIDKLYSNCDMMNSVTEKIVFLLKDCAQILEV